MGFRDPQTGKDNAVAEAGLQVEGRRCGDKIVLTKLPVGYNDYGERRPLPGIVFKGFLQIGLVLKGFRFY